MNEWENFQIVLNLTKGEYDFIVSKAEANKVTVKDFIWGRMFIPNKETMEAMQELNDPEKRKKLKTYKNSKELWDDLGI